jgi:hypothetical protein
MRFFPQQHIVISELQKDFCCRKNREHLQGLITFLAFIAPGSLKSFFIPEMLTGFPSQSFTLRIKADNPLGLPLLSCGSFFEYINGG